MIPNACNKCGKDSPEYFGEALMGSLTCTNAKCDNSVLIVAKRHAPYEEAVERWNYFNIVESY